MNDFKTDKDLIVIQQLLNYSQQTLSEKLKIGRASFNRWKSNQTEISYSHLETIYDFAFRNNIRLNKIKEQLCREDCSGKNEIILFHGAKTNIEGKISVSKSKDDNDFGKGFYCGQTLEQSAMFVANYPKSSLYILSFNENRDLKNFKFNVDRDWMLAISYFRKKIKKYENSKIIKNILKKIKNADYIIAPIADNRMFQIIDEFIEGQITDVQCQHCLSSTNLGLQYVFVTEKSLKNIKILHHCYLANAEKEYYLKNRQQETKIGNDKVKIAKKQYRGKGLYIDEILK